MSQRHAGSRRLSRRRFLTGMAAGVGAVAAGSGASLWLPRAGLTPVRSASAAELELPVRFHEVWAATDADVASGAVSRTWLWGPEPRSIVLEPYDEAPGGQRIVAYYDKARMEDNAYRAQPPWDVSSGLLVKDMMEERWQVGDNRYEPRGPATVTVAGDGDDPTGVTYVTLQAVRSRTGATGGSPVAEQLDRDAAVSTDQALAAHGVSYARHVPETSHTLASVFDDYIRQFSGAVYGNDFYLTGFPLTEPYWTVARVGGTPRQVLLQAFERRVLTYTPDNPSAWQVEMGNVGQQFSRWSEDSQGPTCDIETSYPKEIRSDDGTFNVENIGCEIGMNRGTNPEFDINAIARELRQLYPEENYSLIIYDNAADVPTINGENRNLVWAQMIPGYADGKLLYKHETETNNYSLHISVPSDFQEEWHRHRFSTSVVQSLFMYAHHKGDPGGPQGSFNQDTLDALGRLYPREVPIEQLPIYLEKTRNSSVLT